MIEKAELSLLLDYYGAFLTEKQRLILSYSAELDMSLREIADEVGVSRQGVRDHLNKAEHQLVECELRLGLAAKDKKLRAIAASLEGALGSQSPDRIRSAAASAADDIRSLIR